MSDPAYATKNDVRSIVREATDEIAGIIGELTTQFAEEFAKVHKDLAQVHEELARQRDDIRRIFTYLDSIEKQLEINDQERLVIGHQLDRLDKWVHELANKIDYKLSAE